MIAYPNFFIFCSFLFYLAAKFVRVFDSLHKSVSMHNKRDATLTSIPERNETEEDLTTKWVPKKRHEVLKAKYKCLKKLFQIYDATLIGALPQNYEEDDAEPSEVSQAPRRRKRVQRSQSDASAGTCNASSVDVSVKSEGTAFTETVEDDSVADESVKPSTKLSQTMTTSSTATVGCDFQQPPPRITHHPLPYLYHNEKPKLTRFQSFIHRLFGIRPRHRPFILPNGHVLAASDNDIVVNYNTRRRRRRIRFRRRRPKKVQSEGNIRGNRRAGILNFVQSVQQNCLLDTTPRQCPVLGCRMMSYGIINYNDHLNICHFPERKFVCHYCHEGFETEEEKVFHENEHLGIPKLSLDATPPSSKKVIKTQTESPQVSEDKLKKIVSFFDKMVDNERVFCDAKKDTYSESNLQKSNVTESHASTEFVNNKKTFHVDGRRCRKSKSSSNGNADCYHNSNVIKCHICGETFDHRRQLSLHVDLEHRVHNRFSKFHSCAGIVNARPHKLDCVSEDGTLKVQTTEGSRSVLSAAGTATNITCSSVSEIGRKSRESIGYGSSTNIVYYRTSLDSVRQNKSSMNDFVKRVKSSIKGCNYKWEPGTKIINV